MHPRDIPQLPKLPSTLGFQLSSTTFSAFYRSDDLKKVDVELARYEQQRKAYERACKEFLRSGSDLAARNMIESFRAAVSAFRSADQTFQDVARNVVDWGPGQHNGRGDSNGVANLWKELQTDRTAIEQGWATIDRMSMQLGGPVMPRQNHQIWLGGMPSEQAMRNASLWAQSNQYDQVNLWIDTKNLLGADFKASTDRLRGPHLPASEQHDPAITARLNTWQGASALNYADGLDARLVATQNPQTLARLQQRHGELQQLQVWAQNNNVTLRDASELFTHGPHLPHGPNALTLQERERAQLAYQRELGERCNFAAASDLMRPLILHDHPGLYCDNDMPPPIHGLRQLTDAWNQVAIDSLNAQQHKREKYSTQSPNFPLMTRQVDQMRIAGHTDIPKPINHADGNYMLDNPAYVRLLAAVEEHLDTLRPGFQDNGQRPQYDRLLSFAGQHGARVHMQQAFNQWRGQTPNLQNAFDQTPQLNVAADSFRSLATRRNVDGGSNQVLASSTAGSAGLRSYVNTVTSNSERRFQNHPRVYMDDVNYPEGHNNAGRYRAMTINTTGPEVLSQLPGRDGHDPSLRLPHSYLPNFSATELDHTWFPGQQPHTLNQGPGAPGPGAAMNLPHPQHGPALNAMMGTMPTLMGTPYPAPGQFATPPGPTPYHPTQQHSNYGPQPASSNQPGGFVPPEVRRQMNARSSGSNSKNINKPNKSDRDLW